ncbi:MAG: hypothetical protein NTY20_05895 [Candidatus Aenigmarchaeota archaeon]|nr:hypothetical protein [Candidatus Aenigmarchaeota archaeon]
MESLAGKARNYFMIGVIAENLGMAQEAACNFFEAIFAADDAKIFEIVKDRPKDHNERFTILKARLPVLYDITDRLFAIYKRSGIKDLDMPEVRIVKNRVTEVFEHAGIPVPGDEEVRKRVEELARKKP